MGGDSQNQDTHIRVCVDFSELVHDTARRLLCDVADDDYVVSSHNVI